MDRSKDDMDMLLQSIDTSKVQGYQEYMQAIILEGISNHGLNCETLNSLLFGYNKQVYEAVCEKAISYFDLYAPKSSNPLGIEHVWAMTSCSSI